MAEVKYIVCDRCGAMSDKTKVSNVAVYVGWETCPADGKSEDVFARADLCEKCSDIIKYKSENFEISGDVDKHQIAKAAMVALYGDIY